MQPASGFRGSFLCSCVFVNELQYREVEANLYSARHTSRKHDAAGSCTGFQDSVVTVVSNGLEKCPGLQNRGGLLLLQRAFTVAADDSSFTSEAVVRGKFQLRKSDQATAGFRRQRPQGVQICRPVQKFQIRVPV